MKKIFKLLIALVVIAGIAVGVYFIFFNKKHNNGDIYAKALAFANNDVVSAVNETVIEMKEDLDTVFSGQLTEVNTFFAVFIQTNRAYSVHGEQILTYGIFINEQKNNKIVDQMNKAYDNVCKIYIDSYNYLENMEYGANKNVEYIQNFYNVFKNALNEINAFYYNASVAFAHATVNLMEHTNLQKAKVEYSAVLANEYVKEYLTNKTNNLTIAEKATQVALSVKNVAFDTYLNNKDAIDNILATSKNMNLAELAKQHIDNTFDSYISQISNEAEKTKIETYYNLVIKG